MVKISVVVPTMNEEKYLQPCIDSFQAQTYKDFEVVAIDASKDSTPKICTEAGWKVVKQVSKGVSLARAEGFAATSGEIVACTDADTAVDKQWTERVAKAFENDKVVCVYGPVYLRECGPVLTFVAGVFYNTIFLRFSRWIRRDNVSGQNFAIRKSAYDAIGGFRADLVTAEDVDLGLRVRKLGKVIYDKKMGVHTSARRLLAEGPLHFIGHNILNFLRITLTGKASSNFKPIR
ncbi:glycosyl transferase GTA-type super family [Candidatus Termititenax dinenymphae]|uniref:4,4'-diaponeurosporenoate glycosyltransferase n=1 Tax=Candidatus Termititenax dinenymphae TaxID=2218523 RepID=A0A388TJA4_9BACT|nr:glycosyl transferase GTA-type super family [Candidatus Termititenax dinenymphae]